jgi:tetratricopeptide (TPR) repeat protein
MLKGFGHYNVTDEDGQVRSVNPGALGVNIVAVVDRVDGSQVWIKANGAGDAGVGWVDKKEVILLEDAIKHFSAEIAKNKNDWDAYLRRAESEHALNKRDEAIADYSAAIRLHPSEPFLCIRRGRTYRILKACDKAAADFQQAIRLRPQWAEPYNLAAGVYLDTSCSDAHFADPQKAIELIQHAIALNPKLPVYLTVLAYAYSQKGELEKAVETQRQALESPAFPTGYRDGATNQLHEYEKALAAQQSVKAN